MDSVKILIASLFLQSVCQNTFAVDYFPKGYFDPANVTKVTWAHGVNSITQLNTSIQDPLLHMLEADVVIGTITGSNDTTPIPIMAHPPATTSDLSLAMFLMTVVEHNKNITELKAKKGIKLDFKTLPAAQMSIALLNETRKNETNPEHFNFPIWINADILAGPVNASNANVDPVQFCALRTQAPNTTVSIGWTTRYGKQSSGEIIANGSYSNETMMEMAALIQKEFISNTIDVEITFPLRARLALNSVANIKYLLDNSGINITFPSITLWEGAEDLKITLTELNAFINEIGPHRVFVDLPTSFPKDSGSSGWVVKTESKIVATLLFLVAGLSLFM